MNIIWGIWSQFYCKEIKTLLNSHIQTEEIRIILINRRIIITFQPNLLITIVSLGLSGSDWRIGRSMYNSTCMSTFVWENSSSKETSVTCYNCYSRIHYKSGLVITYVEIWKIAFISMKEKLDNLWCSVVIPLPGKPQTWMGRIKNLWTLFPTIKREEKVIICWSSLWCYQTKLAKRSLFSFSK